MSAESGEIPAVAADFNRTFQGAVTQEQPVKSLLELRHHDVIIQSWDLSCGAAALATLLKYEWGTPVTEKQVANGLMARREYIENPTLVHDDDESALIQPAKEGLNKRLRLDPAARNPRESATRARCVAFLTGCGSALYNRAEDSIRRVLTNLAFADWPSVFGDAKMTTTLLDRLTIIAKSSKPATRAGASNTVAKCHPGLPRRPGGVPLPCRSWVPIACRLTIKISSKAE